MSVSATRAACAFPPRVSFPRQLLRVFAHGPRAAREAGKGHAAGTPSWKQPRPPSFIIRRTGSRGYVTSRRGTAENFPPSRRGRNLCFPVVGAGEFRERFGRGPRERTEQRGGAWKSGLREEILMSARPKHIKFLYTELCLQWLLP